MQRLEIPAPVGDAPAAPPVPSAAAPAEPGAGVPAVPTVPTGASLDELVRRLFDPLSARLKDELRLDRERAGLISDLRR